MGLTLGIGSGKKTKEKHFLKNNRIPKESETWAIFKVSSAM